MNCEMIRDLIPMYIDKTASTETMKAVEKHIDGCEDCKRFAMSCKNSEKKGFGRAKDKILSKLYGEKVEISDVDRQYACLSQKIKKRKTRQRVIAIFVLLGMAAYVTIDIIKAVHRKKNSR